MSNKVEIEKVVLKVGGKEVSLTVEEAKELMKLLDDTFGEKIVTVPITYPVPYPVYPIYPDYPYRYWQVIWNNTSAESNVLYYTAK